jgi:hypothetical protein
MGTKAAAKSQVLSKVNTSICCDAGEVNNTLKQLGISVFDVHA